jgi:glycosyltransferase involved in cell wall biosynthesis
MAKEIIRQKSILLDFERMRDLYTGFYNFNLNFGRAVLKLATDKFDFSFYMVPWQFGMFGNHYHYESKKSYAIPKKNFFSFLRKKENSYKKYDVIHISDQHSTFQPFDTNAKIILTIHDLNYLAEESPDVKSVEKENERHQRMIDMADHIVCISNFSRDTVLANLDTKNKPIDVIYQGCKLDELPIITRPRYLPKRRFLFAISNLYPKKNFHVLTCLLKDNDLELVISGVVEHPRQRAYVKVIMESAKVFGVADRVIITGPVSEQEKQWYYKNCMAFMFPSLAEGFGIPPLEAMYFGKPVFASTFTSVPEICGDAAYYFTSFEPSEMVRIFKEGMLHYETVKPVQKIKERYEFFSWDKTAKAYIELYEKL